MRSASVLRRALRRERRSVAWALAAGSSLALCIVGLSASSAWLLFRSSERPSVLSLTVMMGLVQLFALGRSAARYAERTLIHRAGLAAMAHVRLDVLSVVTRLLPAGLGPRSDAVLTTVLSDVEAVQQLLTASLSPIVIALVGSVSTLFLAAAVDHSAGVVLITLVLTGIVLPFFGGRLRHASELLVEVAQLDLRRVTSQSLRDADGVRTTGRLEVVLAEMERCERQLTRALHRRGWWQGIFSGVTLLLNGGCVAWLVDHGLRLFHAGSMSWPLVAVMPLTMLTTLDLLAATTGLFATTAGQRRSLRRIELLFERSDAVREPLTPHTPMTIRHIVAKNLVAVVDDEEISPSMDLAIGPGDVVALVGPSGSGKSSLARTLVRFMEYGGSLQTEHVELREFLGTSVREHVGFVDDAPHIFATTLRENLTLARPSATDEDLIEALTSAGLGDLLASMPEGLSTQLGGRHDQVSGGERRRIGVARELLSNRGVAVFDEPTEGLDRGTANFVLQSLRSHYADRALLVISHQSLETLAPTQQISL